MVKAAIDNLGGRGVCAWTPNIQLLPILRSMFHDAGAKEHSPQATAFILLQLAQPLNCGAVGGAAQAAIVAVYPRRMCDNEEFMFVSSLETAPPRSVLGCMDVRGWSPFWSVAEVRRSPVSHHQSSPSFTPTTKRGSKPSATTSSSDSRSSSRIDLVFFGRWARRELQRMYGEDFCSTLVFSLSEVRYLSISMHSGRESKVGWLEGVAELGEVEGGWFFARELLGSVSPSREASLRLLNLEEVVIAVYEFSGELWNVRILADVEREKKMWPEWTVPKLEFKAITDGSEVNKDGGLVVGVPET
jgi:hypothetical protein